MSKITIPPAALEAGARAACRAVEKAHGDMQSWNYLGYENVEAFVDAAWPNYVEQTRAAFVAMAEAWEGMHTHEWQRPWLGGMSGTDLILPLTEKQDGNL